MVGATNTLVTLFVIYLLLKASYGNVASNATGYAIGVVLGFLLNRSFTFGSGVPLIEGLLRYGLVTLVAYVINLSVVMILLQSEYLNPMLAHIAGVPVYTSIAFLGSKIFVFRDAQGRTEAPQ